MSNDKEKQQRDQRLKELAKQVLIQAQKHLSSSVPLLLQAIYQLQLKPLEEEGPVQTDGIYLYYWPKTILQMYRQAPALPECCLLHAVLHCLLGHPFQRPTREPERQVYDVICDMIIRQLMEHGKAINVFQ